jgi:hypothetical protein
MGRCHRCESCCTRFAVEAAALQCRCARPPTKAHVNSHALAIRLIRRHHLLSHCIAKHAAQAVVNVLHCETLRPELLCSQHAGAVRVLQANWKTHLTAKCMPSAAMTYDRHVTMANCVIVVSMGDLKASSPALKRRRRTLRVREGAQLDCRHLDCANSSAHSLLSCMPCSGGGRQPSLWPANRIARKHQHHVQLQ